MSKTTKWLLVASSLWYFGEGLFGPLFAVFSEKVGGDLLDITWAWALYLIITGIAYVAIGRIFNRSKWKYHMIVVGYGLNTVFTFAYLGQYFFMGNRKRTYPLCFRDSHCHRRTNRLLFFF